MPFGRQPIKDGADQIPPGDLVLHSAVPRIIRRVYWIYRRGRRSNIDQPIPDRSIDEGAEVLRCRFTPPVVVKNFGEHLVSGALDFGTLAHPIETADQQIAVFSPPSDEDTLELV